MAGAWTDTSRLGHAVATLEDELAICKELAHKLDELAGHTARLSPSMNQVIWAMSDIGMPLDGNSDLFEMAETANAMIDRWTEEAGHRANLQRALSWRARKHERPLEDLGVTLVEVIEKMHDFTVTLIEEAGSLSAVWLRVADADGDTYAAELIDALEGIRAHLHKILRAAPEPGRGT